MDVDFVFKIAGLGILIALIGQVLTRAGRDDMAMLATLSGLVVALMMVAAMIARFFTDLRGMFAL